MTVELYVVVSAEAHLYRVLQIYTAYYNACEHARP